MANYTWRDAFDAFLVEFEKYVGEFTVEDPAQRYVQQYQNNKDKVRNGQRKRGTDQPLFRLNCAVRLLLDGRRKLTPKQRSVRETLEAKWIRLERSCGAVATKEAHRIGYPEGYKEM